MIIQGLALVGAAVLWKRSSPRPEIKVADSVVIDSATARAISAVDHSADFADGLEHFPSDVPGIDDYAFVDDRTALVAAVDGYIWKVDLDTHAAQPFVNVPLMAYGLHEAPAPALDGLVAGGGGGDAVAVALQGHADGLPDGRVVLHQQDGGHSGPWQAEDPLGDDVLQDLVGPAGDAGGGQPQLARGVLVDETMEPAPRTASTSSS